MELDFQTFHLYNRLVRRGLVKPLTCRHCPDSELVLMLGKDEQPNFHCFSCGTTVIPGLDLYNRCRAVVKEHFP